MPVRSSAQGGFTLVELLVVLALAAMLTGIVAPALSRGLEAAVERGTRQDTAALLRSLPLRAMAAGQMQVWDADALTIAMPLPEGWRWQLERPLRYGPNGVAEGGRLALRSSRGEVFAWKVEALSGEVQAL